MRKHPYLLAIAACNLIVLPTQAGEDVSPKGGIVIPIVVPECSERQIQPLFTRYAQTTKKWTLRATHRTFKDMELQEADQFDGTSQDVELTIPLADRLQARIYYPFKTEGDARHVGTGSDLDIDGNGGLLRYPSITLDYQFREATAQGEYNLAAYFGLGNVRQFLEATYLNGKRQGNIDRYNHKGNMAMFGIKADKQMNDCWTFVANAGVRYYWTSDDIHPNDGPDTFFLFELSAAFVYAPRDAWIYPVIEVVYEGSVTDYNSLQIVPQVVIPIGEHIDINAGISVGLLDDGPSTDARVQMTLRF